jgi:hypothetical protein
MFASVARRCLLAGFFIAFGHHQNAEPSHRTWRRPARSAVALSSDVRPDARTCSNFPTVRIALRIVFPLFTIVLAPAGFLKPTQSLAL